MIDMHPRKGMRRESPAIETGQFTRESAPLKKLVIPGGEPLLLAASGQVVVHSVDLLASLGHEEHVVVEG